MHRDGHERLVMAIELAWVPEESLFLIGNVLALVLAAMLLIWDGFRPASRLFAIYLIFRSSADVAIALMNMAYEAGDSSSALLFARLRVFGLLGTPLILLSFAAVYPRRMGWLGTRTGIRTMGGLVGVLFLAYLVWPRAVETLVFAGSRFSNAGGFWFVESFGPLSIMLVAAMVVEAWLGPWFLREYIQAPEGAGGRVLFFLAIGFSAQTVFYGMQALDGLRSLSGTRLEQIMFGTQWVLVGLAMLLVIGQFGVLLARGAALGRRTQHRHWIGLGTLAIPFVGGLMITLYGYGIGGTGVLLASRWIQGFAWLLLPMFCTYALLRCSMFDIDIRLRWTLHKSSLAGVFVAVYFIASEWAAKVLGDRLNDEVYGILATGVLLFFFAPVQRMIERFVNRAVPDGKPLEDRAKDEQVQFYRDQVELVWQDGVIGVKERTILRNLRDKLGISLTIADRIEEEVTTGAAMRQQPVARQAAG